MVRPLVAEYNFCTGSGMRKGMRVWIKFRGREELPGVIEGIERANSTLNFKGDIRVRTDCGLTGVLNPERVRRIKRCPCCRRHRA